MDEKFSVTVHKLRRSAFMLSMVLVVCFMVFGSFLFCCCLHLWAMVHLLWRRVCLLSYLCSFVVLYCYNLFRDSTLKIKANLPYD